MMPRTIMSLKNLPFRVTSASITASIGGAWMAFERNSPMLPSRRSLIERAISWRGVRNISGVRCSSRLSKRAYEGNGKILSLHTIKTGE